MDLCWELLQINKLNELMRMTRCTVSYPGIKCAKSVQYLLHVEVTPVSSSVQRPQMYTCHYMTGKTGAVCYVCEFATGLHPIVMGDELLTVEYRI